MALPGGRRQQPADGKEMLKKTGAAMISASLGEELPASTLIQQQTCESKGHAAVLPPNATNISTPSQKRFASADVPTLAAALTPEAPKKRQRAR